MKLHYFVTILTLGTYEGIVCVHTSGEVASFNARCSALIDVAIAKFDGNLLTVFKVIARIGLLFRGHFV